MRLLLRVWMLVALISLPLVAFGQGRPAGVSTEFVRTSTTSETVSVFGEVVAGRESAVAARVGGVAQGVPVQVGDMVAEGDILARLDTELLEIELAQAEAQVAIAEAGIAVADAQLDRAQKALRRAVTLRRNATISEAQLEDRESDFAEARGAQSEAQARLKSSHTALDQARYRLKNAIVHAPFDAVILELSTEVGQFIASGSQVATLIDLQSLEVEANIPARFVQALQPDQMVVATTDAGSTVSLLLRAVLPTEFSATRTRPVRFELATETTTIAVGQTVTLDVPVSKARDVLIVPKDAILQSRDGWSVFVHQDGKAMPRPVEIGAALENAFEVVSGLVEGDEVVVRGNERLRPGQDIAPTNPSERARPDTGASANSSEHSRSDG